MEDFQEFHHGEKEYCQESGPLNARTIGTPAAAFAKLLVSAVAVVVAAVLLAALYILSAPLGISADSARINVNIYNRPENGQVRYVLTTAGDPDTILDEGMLEKNEQTLMFAGLTPGTAYQVTYYEQQDDQWQKLDDFWFTTDSEGIPAELPKEEEEGIGEVPGDVQPDSTPKEPASLPDPEQPKPNKPDDIPPVIKPRPKPPAAEEEDEEEGEEKPEEEKKEEEEKPAPPPVIAKPLDAPEVGIEVIDRWGDRASYPYGVSAVYYDIPSDFVLNQAKLYIETTGEKETLHTTVEQEQLLVNEDGEMTLYFPVHEEAYGIFLTKPSQVKLRIVLDYLDDTGIAGQQESETGVAAPWQEGGSVGGVMTKDEDGYQIAYNAQLQFRYPVNPGEIIVDSYEMDGRTISVDKSFSGQTAEVPGEILTVPAGLDTAPIELSLTPNLSWSLAADGDTVPGKEVSGTFYRWIGASFEGLLSTGAQLIGVKEIHSFNGAGAAFVNGELKLYDALTGITLDSTQMKIDNMDNLEYEHGDTKFECYEDPYGNLHVQISRVGNFGGYENYLDLINGSGISRSGIRVTEYERTSYSLFSRPALTQETRTEEPKAATEPAGNTASIVQASMAADGSYAYAEQHVFRDLPGAFMDVKIYRNGAEVYTDYTVNQQANGDVLVTLPSQQLASGGSVESKVVIQCKGNHRRTSTLTVTPALLDQKRS